MWKLEQYSKKLTRIIIRGKCGRNYTYLFSKSESRKVQSLQDQHTQTFADHSTPPPAMSLTSKGTMRSFSSNTVRRHDQPALHAFQQVWPANKGTLNLRQARDGSSSEGRDPKSNHQTYKLIHTHAQEQDRDHDRHCPQVRVSVTQDGERAPRGL